jgi:uncharacterized protein YbaR (Trm112 family)
MVKTLFVSFVSSILKLTKYMGGCPMCRRPLVTDPDQEEDDLSSLQSYLYDSEIEDDGLDSHPNTEEEDEVI